MQGPSSTAGTPHLQVKSQDFSPAAGLVGEGRGAQGSCRGCVSRDSGCVFWGVLRMTFKVKLTDGCDLAGPGSRAEGLQSESIEETKALWVNVP